MSICHAQHKLCCEDRKQHAVLGVSQSADCLVWSNNSQAKTTATHDMTFRPGFLHQSWRRLTKWHYRDETRIHVYRFIWLVCNASRHGKNWCNSLHCTCPQSVHYKGQGPYHHYLFIRHALWLEKLTDRDHVLLNAQFPGLYSWTAVKLVSLPSCISACKQALVAVHLIEVICIDTLTLIFTERRLCLFCR